MKGNKYAEIEVDGRLRPAIMVEALRHRAEKARAAVQLAEPTLQASANLPASTGDDGGEGGEGDRPASED